MRDGTVPGRRRGDGGATDVEGREHAVGDPDTRGIGTQRDQHVVAGGQVARSSRRVAGRRRSSTAPDRSSHGGKPCCPWVAATKGAISSPGVPSGEPADGGHARAADVGGIVEGHRHRARGDDDGTR